MKRNFRNRLLIAAALATAAPLVLTSTTAFAKDGDKQEKHQDKAEKKAAKEQTKATREVAKAVRHESRRLDRAQQLQLIAAQQQRVTQYRTWQQSQLSAAPQVAAAIQAQKRAAQYAYIMDYNNRLAQQQQRYATSSFDYNNDPYFSQAPNYRYQREGQYYTTNQQGANVLQQAVNDGYGEGQRAGRADRQDGWRADFRSSYVYQNASYGFNGYYGDRNEYAYYFRQGFERGYQDGYSGRQQYGSYNNGRASIIGTVLNTILNLQSNNGY